LFYIENTEYFKSKIASLAAAVVVAHVIEFRGRFRKQHPFGESFRSKL
jgi:hypothetical protein